MPPDNIVAIPYLWSVPIGPDWLPNFFHNFAIMKLAISPEGMVSSFHQMITSFNAFSSFYKLLLTFYLNWILTYLFNICSHVVWKLSEFWTNISFIICAVNLMHLFDRKTEWCKLIYSGLFTKMCAFQKGIP